MKKALVTGITGQDGSYLAVSRYSQSGMSKSTSLTAAFPAHKLKNSHDLTIGRCGEWR